MSEPLLITNCTLLPEVRGPIQPDSFLLCKQGKITACGPMADCPNSPEARVLDGRGRLLTPGLINGHCHAAMTLFRGLADDLALEEWLNRHIFPAEAAHVNPEMVHWCSKLAAAEMLLAGTTCVADAYFHEHEAARAFTEAGLRSVAACGVIDFPAPGVPDPAKNIEAAAEFINAQQGQPLSTPAVFAHAPYTCSNATLTAAKALARDQGVRFFIHAAETRGEQGLIAEPKGESPIQHLAALDLLDQETTLIHCTWLDEQDLDLIAASGAAVALCPQSNQKLASGTAPATAMLTRGIPAGLGTDGCASNNSLDLFREMDLLAKEQKVSGMSATALPARDALACATELGAIALGLDHLGRLAPGLPADLILIDLERPHLQPFSNQDILVYGASGADVSSVVVNGRLVVDERQVLSFDLNECLDRVRALAEPLIRQVGQP